MRRIQHLVAAGLSTHRHCYLALAGITVLVLLDLAVNLLMLNPGEPDVLTVLGFARGLVHYGAWPGNPYFPPGYPLLLIPFGYMGSMLVGGYLLSALGLWLALWAVHNLALTLGASRIGAFITAVLCWMMPITRSVYCTPHVDALFNGLALWFIAAAIAYWHFTDDARGAVRHTTPPSWVAVGLLLPVLLMPLLRNHAAALVLPVLVVLACCRRRGWRLLAGAAVLFVAVATFNQLSYVVAYDQVQPSIWRTYYRVGLELDFHQFYPSTEAIGNNYEDLAERSRNVSLLADYSPKQILVHSARQFWLFFRRPAIALGIILGILAPLVAPRLKLRRRLPSAITPAAWWALLYLIVLCPAYFNTRNGAPQALVGMVIVTTVVGLLASARGRRLAWVAVCTAFLLFAMLYFPRHIYARHYMCHSAGAAVERYVHDRGLQYSDVLVDGIALIPLYRNPWGERYSTVKIGWRNDPAIHQDQLAMLRQYEVEKLARGQGELPKLYICPLPPPFDRNERVTRSAYWRQIDVIAGMGVFAPADPGERLATALDSK